MPESTFPLGNTREAVLGAPINAVSYTEAVDCIFRWAQRQESRTVCVCGVHSVITALRNLSHADAIRFADLVTPDGSPIAWMLRRKGHGDQERMCGPDLMWTCCRRASELGTKIFLYGGAPATLGRLEQALRREFPGINIVGTYSPPFRRLTAEEDAAVVDIINDSGARIVWVGLGCPKQEAWMHAHRGRVTAVMLGVGAAFDFHSGVVRRAPLWMQRNGLEWLHRLSQDPRRLAMRYLMANSMFVVAGLLDSLFPQHQVDDR